MDRTLVSALIAVAAVVVLGLVARRFSTGSNPSPDRPSGGAPDDAPEAEADATSEAGEAPDADEEAPESAVAITSDGLAFMADAHAVRIVPPDSEGDAWPSSAAASGRDARGASAIAMSMHAGDYRGGRVVRGSAGLDPWRLELLGPDGEYVVWSFETREGATAALALLEAKKVVQPGRDEDGRPAPPSAEAFEEARRIFEETEEALAMDDEPDAEEPRR